MDTNECTDQALDNTMVHTAILNDVWYKNGFAWALATLRKHGKPQVAASLGTALPLTITEVPRIQRCTAGTLRLK